MKGRIHQFPVPRMVTRSVSEFLPLNLNPRYEFIEIDESHDVIGAIRAMRSRVMKALAQDVAFFLIGREAWLRMCVQLINHKDGRPRFEKKFEIDGVPIAVDLSVGYYVKALPPASSLGATEPFVWCDGEFL